MARAMCSRPRRPRNEVVDTLAVLMATAAAVASAPAPGSAATAQAAAPLERYLTDLRTLRASFLQTLSDAQGREIDRASGTLIVQRPGKFSWDTHPQSRGV